ncbi:MAG: hypothetical protein A2Y33_05710 [Spirochaetes bacterium GWF1_51_8]|nr:MAG: hypothetical protein A2Y33_05710 [Spirochaetes bacterium GWF1_51_8]
MKHFREEYKVKRLGIFGSVARNESTGESDLDLLVEFEEGEATFDHYMDLKFYIEDNLEIKVDLVTKAALRKEYRDQVLEETIYVG